MTGYSSDKRQKSNVLSLQVLRPVLTAQSMPSGDACHSAARFLANSDEEAISRLRFERGYDLVDAETVQ